MSISEILPDFHQGKYRKTIQRIDEMLDDHTDREDVRIELITLKADSLHHLAEFDKALNLIDRYLETNSPPPKHRCKLTSLKMELLRKTGRGDKAAAMYQQSKSLLDIDVLDNQSKADFYFASGNVMLFKGELEDAKHLLEEALNHALQSADRYRISNAKNNLGVVNYDLGEFDVALEFLEDALKEREAFGNKIFIAQTLNNIGIIYDDKGKLQRALEYYERSLALYKELNIPLHIASAYNNIGEVLRAKGELDLALDYYKNSHQLFKTLDNQHFVGIGLHNIARVLFEKGELEEAKRYFIKAEHIRELVGHENFIAETYFQLLRIYLALDEKDGILRIGEKFGKIIEDSTNVRILQYGKLASALVLKATPSSKERIKAQEILEELSEEQVVDHQLSALALIHLADLLIHELKMYRQDNVFDEINNIINKLYEIAQNQYNLRLVIQVLILLSRLKLIELKLEESEHLLQQARILAVENSMIFLEKQIQQEIDQLHQYIKLHKESIEISDLAERVDKMELDQYIENLRQDLE